MCRCDKERNSLRRYYCDRCKCEVLICRHCDRGNIYCNSGCARTRRIESIRSAERNYQMTDRGKANHAARQKKWRYNKKGVTDHSSNLEKAVPSSPSVNETAVKEDQGTDNPELSSPGSLCKAVRPRLSGDCCHFCGRRGVGYYRHGSLNGRKSRIERMNVRFRKN